MSAENWALANAPTADYFLLSKFQRYLNHDAAYATRLKLKSIRTCCRLSLNSNGNVHVLVEERDDKKTGEVKRKAHFTNLAHCSSLWACPVCTAYRLRKYADKITALIRRRNKLGEKAYMLTFTIPHGQHQSAKEVIGRLYELKRRTIGHGSYSYYKKQLGVSGHVQSTECTYTTIHGWHFHIHMLIFVKDAADVERAVCEFREKVQRLWVKKWDWELPKSTDMDYWLNKSVYLSVDEKGSPREIESGDYICGYGAMEMAKVSNNSSKSANVFDLLASDNPRDQELFIEYALATRGLKRVNMSPGMSRCIQPEDYREEKIQDEIVSVQKKKREVVCSFTLSKWRAFCDREYSTGLLLRAELLQAAIEAADPFTGVRRWAQERGLPEDFVDPPRAKILQYAEQFEHERAGYYS